MEVKGTLARWWQASAEAIGAFLDELAFRCVLAYHVLAGRVPIQSQKRLWNRRAEVPVLVDVFDWTDDRRFASILVWPPLESAEEDAAYHHMLRVEQMKGVVCKGAAEMVWSTKLETDWGLQWDPDRKVWVCSDGFAYDGQRATDRQPSGRGRDPGRGHTSGAVLLSLDRPVPDSEANEEAS